MGDTLYKIYIDNTDEHIANIYYNKGIYRGELLRGGTDIPIVFGFPEFGSISSPNSECLEAFLSNRVIPPNRDYLKEILHANGIYEYDWRELIKLNKGRTVDDWFRVEVEELE